MEKNIKKDTDCIKNIIENINKKLGEIELLTNDLSSIKQTFYAMDIYEPSLAKDYNDFENSLTLFIIKLKRINNHILQNVINNYDKLGENVKLSLEELMNILNNF